MNVHVGHVADFAEPALVFAHVVGDDGLARLGDDAGDAHAQRQLHAVELVRAFAGGQVKLQGIGFLVEHQ